MLQQAQSIIAIESKIAAAKLALAELENLRKEEFSKLCEMSNNAEAFIGQTEDGKFLKLAFRTKPAYNAELKKQVATRSLHLIESDKI